MAEAAVVWEPMGQRVTSSTFAGAVCDFVSLQIVRTMEAYFPLEGSDACTTRTVHVVIVPEAEFDILAKVYAPVATEQALGWQAVFAGRKSKSVVVVHTPANDRWIVLAGR